MKKHTIEFNQEEKILIIMGSSYIKIKKHFVSLFIFCLTVFNCLIWNFYLSSQNNIFSFNQESASQIKKIHDIAFTLATGITTLGVIDVLLALFEMMIIWLLLCGSLLLVDRYLFEKKKVKEASFIKALALYYEKHIKNPFDSETDNQIREKLLQIKNSKFEDKTTKLVD